MKEKIKKPAVDSAEVIARPTAELALENLISRNVVNSEFLRNVAPFFQGELKEEILFDVLKRIKEANLKTPVKDREELFCEALNYFGNPRSLRYPVGHATGSDALRLITEHGAIRRGGSGEHGEGVLFARSAFQESVSVAEMQYPESVYLLLDYARMAANPSVTKEILLINSDAIDGKTVLEDYVKARICGNFEKTISILAGRMGLEVEILKEAMAKENGVDIAAIKPSMILKNEIIKAFVADSITKSAERKHYRTFEKEEMNYTAYSYLLECCEKGDWPRCHYQGRVLNNPIDILSVANDEDKPPISVEEKIFEEIYEQYTYFLKTYRDEDGRSLSMEKFLADKARYLAEMKAWWEKPYKNLLYPFPDDSDAEKERKAKRLGELANQYPIINIIEGGGFCDKKQLFSQQTGQKPVEVLVEEERIMVDIPLSEVKEIIVPKDKIPEVKGWLMANGADEEIKIVPMEYFEIKRLIEHQIEM